MLRAANRLFVMGKNWSWTDSLARCANSSSSLPQPLTNPEVYFNKVGLDAQASWTMMPIGDV